MDVVQAIEENCAELLMAMGAAGGGSQRDDASARWTIGGSPIDYHNAVVAAGDLDRAIPESVAELRRYGVPGSWHVGPALRTADLGDRLLAAGFTYGGSEPGMAVALAELIAPTAVPGLSLERITDDAGLAIWAQTLGRGFGEGEKEARWVASVYRTLGYADPWRHYLATLDGAPLGTITIYLAAGVAGVYFVMTVPEARRRGIGAWLTHAALTHARADTQYAVLGSSPAGRSVYNSLGLRTHCSIDLYELAVT